MENSGVYKIRNTINNNIYIGSTISLNDRKNTHLYDLRNNRHHSIILQKEANQFGLDSFLFEVIEYISDKNNLIVREQYYIDILLPVYNICKIAGSSLGRISTRRKAIIQYDLKGTPIREWDCLEHAVPYLGVTNSSKISQCCKGNRNKAHGFIWRYKNSNLPLILESKTKASPVAEVDIEGNVLRVWKTVKECAKILNSRPPNICNVLSLKNRYKTIGGKLLKRLTTEEYNYFKNNNNMPNTPLDEIQKAQSWVDANATINSNLTYEQGVIAALRWTRGDTTTLPIQGYFDGKRGVPVVKDGLKEDHKIEHDSDKYKGNNKDKDKYRDIGE